MQSKKYSRYESIANTVAGLVLSFIVQLLIYPFLEIEVTLSENIFITFIFLLVSYFRSYTIRRIFNSIKEVQEAKEPPKDLDLENDGVSLLLSQIVIDGDYHLSILDPDGLGIMELSPEQLKQIEQYIKEQRL